ncbi:hypothetical protein CKO36_13875 [Rhabdochromatium marinum]|nr:hypothetical protein [Rhabdochromatium marinum]
MALPSVYAAQDQDTPVLSGSDPLSLEQALSFADQHPRLKNPAASTRFPRRPALFVGCHDLAFAGARAGEERRNQAWSSPLLSAEDAQRLEVMQRFFDVLLADLSFAHDNEAMAVAFVQLDRARARAELGQFSPLQVAKLDADYQAIRRQRAASESTQRLTRALLAQALGHPQTLPEHLTPPKPPPADQAIPTLAEVIAAAQQHNPQVRALSNEPQDAAATALLAMDLEQAALELITRLQLLGLIAEQVDTEARWRDLKLDESRTLYELEAQADLGFSMSQQTRARRDQEQVALCQALTRAELAALQGQSLITSTSD